MKILVTNDDGIWAPGLWALVRELKSIAQVAVVAPDREQSATGTSVTLRQPLRVQTIEPLVPGIEAYSVEGTPGDCVILGLEKLVGGVSMVVSGINHGLNLGEDVLISGTVGAALQGYLRGLPAIAMSSAEAKSPYIDDAARLAALLAERISANHLPTNVFLNVNYPSLSLSDIREVKITRLASKSHIDTVDEGHDGKREYYWLIRRKVVASRDGKTDIGAIEEGNISITALAINLAGRLPPPVLDTLCADLLPGLKNSLPDEKTAPRNY